MSTEPSVKLVKKEQRKGSELQAEVECAIDLNRWSESSIPESFSRWTMNLASCRHTAGLVPAELIGYCDSQLFERRLCRRAPGFFACQREINTGKLRRGIEVRATWVGTEAANYASRSRDPRAFRFSFVTLIRKRNASFTASAFGNAPATSGSTLIRSPKLLRPGPSLQTRSVDKSYSGRSPSPDSSFLHKLFFERSHFSRTNQTNDIVSFSIEDD